MKSLEKKEVEKKPKIVLTSLAQQYGLTVEDLMERVGCTREEVEVEKPKKKD